MPSRPVPRLAVLLLVAGGAGCASETPTGQPQPLEGSASVTVSYVATFGGARGTGPGELDGPFNLVWADGSIYVAERYNYRVQRLSPSGAFEAFFGDGYLTAPKGVAVDGDGEVFVANTSGLEVAKFSSGGALLTTFANVAPHDSDAPGDVAVAPNGDVYVADTFNNRVLWFSNSGSYRGQWGGGYAPFYLPRGIATDAAGNVYVSESGADRIQVFDASGTFAAAYPPPGGGGLFANPTGLDVDAAGNLFVADTNNRRVVILGPNGELLHAFGSYGSGDMQFKSPTGVAIAPDGHLYVSDTTNFRIQKYFVDLPATTPMPSPLHSEVSDIVVCPAGDEPYRVVVRDDQGQPMPGSEVTIELSAAAAPLLHFCDGPPPDNRITATADATGTATFWIAAGGCVDAARLGELVATVRADGVTLAATGLSVVSFDATDSAGSLPTDGWGGGGAGVVGLSDLTFHSQAIVTGAYEVCTDFDGNGTVGVGDASRLTAHNDHRCP